MGRANALLLVAVVLAALLVASLGGLAVARWQAAAPLPTLAPDLVLTVTPIPTVPPPATPLATPSVAPSPVTTPHAAFSDPDRALRSVVQIRTTRGQGSGFVWARETTRTLIVTAAHVVEGASSVTVVVSDGTAYPTTVLARDTQRDVAVLAAPAIAGVTPLPLGSTRELPLGAALTVLGYPLGDLLLGDPTVTRGVFSARRTFDGIAFMQTDAAMNPGISGAPVLDVQGRVVGIAVGSIPWAGQIPAQGVNFAVTIEEIERVVSTVSA
ncbi:S1C family serine protease [Thermomicrobium sp.]